MSGRIGYGATGVNMSDVSGSLKPIVHKTRDDYDDNYHPHLLEQYKMAVERAETTAARRESGNRLFFIILTGLAVTYAICIGAQLSVLVPLLGSYICVGWLVFVWSRSKMNFSTFAVIRELEQELPARLFEGERERRIAEQGQTTQVMMVSWFELLMPILFALLFMLLLLWNLIAGR